MTRVAIIDWDAASAAAIAARLRAAGHEPLPRLPRDFATLRRDFAAAPPAAFVIALDRAPATARDIALALRARAATRAVPIVFLGGDAAALAKTRKILPDAAYASTRTLRTTLRRVLAARVAGVAAPLPVSPGVLAGYSGTPLPTKLGVKPATTLALIDAPPGFEALLGPPVAALRIRRSARGAAELALWFIRRRAELERGIAALAARADLGALWICWPKKASALAGDVGETEVRAAGLAHGLVDYKVCAVDATWSGLKFAWRGRSKR